MYGDLMNLRTGAVNRRAATKFPLKCKSGAGAFLFVAWPTEVQLLVFFCSSVSVVLFDTPGISRYGSQHVSVESSSLFHHSIYL